MVKGWKGMPDIVLNDEIVIIEPDGTTVMEIVAGAEVSSPSSAVKAKVSAPVNPAAGV
jgi:hypothetical protein